MSAPWQQALAALRSQGGARVDPVGFHYLEAMARRVGEASGAVRGILEGKLDLALAAYGERMAQQRPARQDLPKEVQALATLNQYIRSVTEDNSEAGMGQDEGGPDIKSARRFRATWSRIAAEKQVAHALGRGPENAGPLNAHMLVLQSLALMRELSPDYLMRFMSQMDTLLWLDQLNQQLALPEAKPSRQGGRAKGGGKASAS